MITPQTKISFLNIPWSVENDKILKFDSEESQSIYFDSKVLFSKSNCLYQRENDNEFIKVGETIDKLYSVNYIAFKNANYHNKMFYAFITKLEWKNGVTLVYYKIDVMQTFMFNYSIGNSFIERETFSEDYYNTISDFPSVGELHSSKIHEEELKGKYLLYFNSEINNDDSTTSEAYFPKVGNYSIPNYVAIYSDNNNVAELIQAISNKGRADRIQCAVYQPFLPIDCITQIGQHDKGDLSITNDITLVQNIDYSECKKDVELNITNEFQYKKEISYPYCKIEVVDKITGQKIELDLSKFENPLNPKFRILGSIGEIPEYKVIPLNYNGIDYAIDYSLIVNPDTELPIFSNSYAKYLKDNKNQNLINGVLSGASAVGSILTGNIAGAIGSFANIASLINQDSVAKSQPNLCKGTSANTCEFTNLDSGIEFRLLTMDSSHLSIARNFWKYYGYPINQYKKPTIQGSYYFIKTQNMNVINNGIPFNFVSEINDIFNKGVSFFDSENNLINY